MQIIYVAKQKIFNKSNKVFGYELLYRDNEYGIENFPTNMKATSHVLMNLLVNLDETFTEVNIMLVNSDAEFLLSNMVDLLDKNKIMLEILETTELNEDVVAKVKQYHARGFKIAIDDFNCSAEMIKKFTPILQYVHLIKIDLIESEFANVEPFIKKFKKMGIKILAEKIETQEDYERCVALDFDLYQGFYLDKPEVVEIERGKDLTKFTVLDLIRLIRNDATTHEIELYIKQRADLSFKLLEFLNLQEELTVKVESIQQVITLLGRDKLLQWLLLYLYAEMADNPVSKVIMEMSLKRAELMESKAQDVDKEKAYLAGIFSLIGTLFDTTNEKALKGIELDKDIMDIVIRRKGKFLSSLVESEAKEQAYLRKVCIESFDELAMKDVVDMLSKNGMEIDLDKI